jgi:hypothetical protein
VNGYHRREALAVSQRLVVLTLSVLAGAAAALAEERPDAESKRGAFVVKHAAAKAQAAILANP